MRINYLSDLHLELGREKIEDYTDLGKDADVVVIAGDLTNSVDIVNSLRILATALFPKDIIYVTGNHDYYRSSKREVNGNLSILHDQHNNLHILQQSSVIIDDVVFIGTTGWQDREDYNEINFFMMNDFHKIEGHGKDVRLFGRSDYNFIKEELKKDWQVRKKVVVTHLTPSAIGINWGSEEVESKNDYINAYYNEWDTLVVHSDLWICGHCHDSIDTPIGKKSRIVRNALGYKKSKRENLSFDRDKIVEI